MDVMNTIGIDGTDAFLLIGFVIGWVQLVKSLFDRNWKAAAIIAVAGVSGGVAGVLLGFPVLTGIVGGLAGSGVVTVAQKFGFGDVTIEETAEE